MKKELLLISACILFALGQVQAQNAGKSLDSSSVENEKIGDRNQAEGEASGGMGALSTTPGVSTTSGAGGLGTIENPGYNTSSDIYNMERKDSIRKAKKETTGKGNRKSKRTGRN